MRVEEYHTTEKKFEPFKMTITVETYNDLFALWHVFNMSHDEVKAKASANYRLPPCLNIGGLWGFINRKIECFGLTEED